MLLVEGDLFPLEFKGLERCVICLFHENDFTEDSDVIPVHVFNKVWKHLVVCEKGKERSFSRTPPVCSECRRTLEKLFGLLTQLEQVTNAIRNTVADTGKNGCYAEQRFFKMLEALKDSRLEDKWKRSTLNLLEQLGHGEIVEEDYQRWFSKEDENVEANNSDLDQEEEDDDCFPEDAIQVIPKYETGDLDEIKIESYQPENPSNPVTNPTTNERADAQVHVEDPLTSCSTTPQAPPHPPSPPPIEKQPVKQIFITLIPPQPKVQRVLKCDLCKDPPPFKREADLIAHNIKCHDADPFECQYCGKKFARKNALQQHEHFHTNINVTKKAKLICDIPGCGKSYNTQKDLEIHKLSVKHAGKKETFVCLECGEGFNTTIHLKAHQRLKHPNLKKVPCKDCKQRFKNLEELRKHQRTHSDIRPFACSLCGQRFRTNIVMQRHLQRHKDNKAKEKLGVVVKPKFICDLNGCGKIYTSLKLLERHKMSVEHVGRTNAFVCNECGKGFNLEGQLRSHERAVHSERKLCCEECGESFKTEDVLQRHKLIHSGERPFECELCGQRFRQKNVLNRHLHGHKEKGESFKPNGPMKGIRKRVNVNNS